MTYNFQLIEAEAEIEKLKAEVERLRDVIEATCVTLDALGWPDAASDLRNAATSALRGEGEK